MIVQISTTFIYQHRALVKFCQDLSQISDDFSVNQEGSKSQCLLLLAFLGLTLDILGNTPDTNTDVEHFLGDLYLGVALLCKNFNFLIN